MRGFGPENGDFGACLLTDLAIGVFLIVSFMCFILLDLGGFWRALPGEKRCVIGGRGWVFEQDWIV